MSLAIEHQILLMLLTSSYAEEIMVFKKKLCPKYHSDAFTTFCFWTFMYYNEKGTS